MANYYGSARSNYFAVKDADAFRVALDPIDAVSIHARGPDGDGRFCLLVDGDDDGGWPSTRYDEARDEWDEWDIFNLVAEHLADGEVAVFMEAGAEKLRYISGYAVAINGAGERREVSLSDIYDLARELGPNVTEAEY